MIYTHITADICRDLATRMLLVCLLSLAGAGSATAASPTDPGYFPNAPLQNQDGETLLFGAVKESWCNIILVENFNW